MYLAPLPIPRGPSCSRARVYVCDGRGGNRSKVSPEKLHCPLPGDLQTELWPTLPLSLSLSLALSLSLSLSLSRSLALSLALCLSLSLSLALSLALSQMVMLPAQVDHGLLHRSRQDGMPRTRTQVGYKLFCNMYDSNIRTHWPCHSSFPATLSVSWRFHPSQLTQLHQTSLHPFLGPSGVLYGLRDT